MKNSITLNLTGEVRAVLESLLTIAERMEDDSQIDDYVSHEPWDDLGEFRRSVYDPLMEKRSVTVGSGENFNLDLQDAGLVFDVIKGLGESWAGGVPWKSLNAAERLAVGRFLEKLRQ